MNKPGNADIRLSFRSTPGRLRKLNALARKHGWINAWGKPNISAVLNHLIDRHVVKTAPAKEKVRG